MKKTNKLLLSAIALAGALFAQSCEKDPVVEIVDPIFPEELIEKTIEGEKDLVTSFTISPNMDWTVEVKGEGVLSHFWIDDDGIKEKSISGKASESETFKVVFTPEKELDINRVCEVVMTMGNKSKTIGKIVKPALERTLTFAVAKKGEVMFTKDFEPAEEVLLETFPEVKTYERPISILANYDWSLVVPEWIECYVNDKLVEGSVEGQANTPVVIRLNAILTENVKNGAEDKLIIRDKLDPQNKYTEFKVTLPAFADRMEVNAPIHTAFAADGLLKLETGNQATPAVSYGFSVEKLVLKAFEWNENGYYELAFPEWVHCLAELDVNNTSDNIIKSYVLSFEMDENTTTKERVVDILALPESLVLNGEETVGYVTEQGDQFNEVYAKYKLVRLTQDAAEPSAPEGDILSLNYGKASVERMTEEDPMYADISTHFGTNQVYKVISKDFSTMLNYTGPEPWGYPAYQTTTPYEPLTDGSVAPEGMMMGESTTITVYVGENVQTNAEAIFTILGENESVLAAVYFVFDVNAEIAGGSDYFTAPYGGATVNRIEETDERYSLYSGEYPDCKEFYEIVATDAAVTLNYDGPEIWSMPLIEAAEPYNKPLAEGLAEAYPMGTMISVAVGETVTERMEFLIRVAGENDATLAIVHYIFDPQSAAGGAPFSFADPAQPDATLELVTGTELTAIQAEFMGVPDDHVYKLTYNVEWPAMCFVNCPGAPFSTMGWNCEFEDVKWLTIEDAGMGVPNQYSIAMSEVGKTDYLVWKTPEGMFTHVLVCTRTN